MYNILMKKKVVITGGSGLIGSILTKKLKDEFEIISLSRQQCDLANFDKTANIIKNDTDVIIHLAWKTGDLYASGHYDTDNVLMTLNVLEVAAQKKIPRVILASSVHTNEYRQSYRKQIFNKLTNASLIPPLRWRGTSFVTSSNITHIDWPTSIYGATKLYFEALGRYYSQYHGLEVVAVRIGGVNPENSPAAYNKPDYKKIFLSHEDLVRIFRDLINKPKIANNYECLYAISRTKKNEKGAIIL